MEKFKSIPESLSTTAFAGGGGNSLNSNFGSLSTQKECIFDLHEQKKKGFTLAETIITLSILGIVAVLTVPSLARRHIEASNKAKVRKAVSVYETMMKQLVVSENLKTNAAIQNWADNDCTNSSELFKVVKFVSTNSKCRFKTADGVFWDITNLQTPVIALKEDDLDEATAKSDTNRAFYLFAEYDSTRVLRVTNPSYAYTIGQSNVSQVNDSVERLWEYIFGDTVTSQAMLTDDSANSYQYRNECETSVCKYNNGDFRKFCSGEKKSCTYYDSTKNRCLVYNENSKRIIDGSTCDTNCMCNSLTEYSDDGNIRTGYLAGLNADGSYSWVYTYNLKGKLIKNTYYNSDKTINYYNYKEYLADDVTLKIEYLYCHSNNICNNVNVYDSDGTTKIAEGKNCYFDGINYSDCSSCTGIACSIEN